MPYLIPDPLQTRGEIVIHHLDDEPRGIRLATSPASDMVVFAAPWARIDELRRNLGPVTVAAYLLAGGAEPDGPIRRLYIGETGALRHRLREHAANPQKAYVSTAYVIACRAPGFGKEDVQGLQHLIDQAAEHADRVMIDRGVRPVKPPLDEAHWAKLGQALAGVRRLLAALGCPVLEPIVPASAPPGHAGAASILETAAKVRRAARHVEAMIAEDGERWGAPDDDPSQHDGRSLLPHGRPSAEAIARDAAQASRFIYRLDHGGVTAEGYQDGQQFVVIPGSLMREEIAPSFRDQKDNLTRRADILAMGVTRPAPERPGLIELKREVRLRSRAVAAKVLTGVNLKADVWRPIPLPASLSALQARDR